MAVKLTIIGLGQIGTSIGLALISQKGQIFRIGHDRETTISNQAEKLGAVDKVIHNLHKAVEDSDIILLAIPVDEIRTTIEQIAPDLKEEAVLMDTSPAMVAVSNWAKELLPEKRYFITLAPSLNPNYFLEEENGNAAAHADLFKNSLMVITCPTGTSPDALKLAADLTALLGADAFFADPQEFEGLTAASRTLPQFAAAALVNATTPQPGWREGCKLAGNTYAWASNPVANLDESEQLGETALLNRENVLRVIDNYIKALYDLRSALDINDKDELKKLLNQAQERRLTWLRQRQTANYGLLIEPPKISTSGHMLSRLVGFNFKCKDKK
jgi:prephenate dehydrogenase